MHMQIKVALGSPSSSSGGPGAMDLTPVQVDPLEVKRGALLELLDLLAANDYDLGLAGGDSIEIGGEFVFALKHDEPDQAGGPEHDRTRECAELLKSNGYHRVRIIEPQVCEAEDRVGGLRDCLAQLVEDGRQIDELYVGTPEDGKIPIHVLTIKTI